MRTKLLLLIFVVVAIATVGIYFYTYQEHRNISAEKALFSVALTELEQEFLENDSLANSKYLDKTIEVYGDISSLDLESSSIVLDSKLSATFKDAIPKSLTQGTAIKIKGRFIGYDDLLEEFKLDQVIIIE